MKVLSVFMLAVGLCACRGQSHGQNPQSPESVTVAAVSAGGGGGGSNSGGGSQSGGGNQSGASLDTLLDNIDPDEVKVVTRKWIPTGCGTASCSYTFEYKVANSPLETIHIGPMSSPDMMVQVFLAVRVRDEVPFLELPGSYASPLFKAGIEVAPQTQWDRVGMSNFRAITAYDRNVNSPIEHLNTRVVQADGRLMAPQMSSTNRYLILYMGRLIQQSAPQPGRVVDTFSYAGNGGVLRLNARFIVNSPEDYPREHLLRATEQFQIRIEP